MNRSDDDAGIFREELPLRRRPDQPTRRDQLRQFPQSEREQPQPVLKTAEQIHRLTREEAARAHRAVIRGVVTCALPDFGAVVIQDSTRGIYSLLRPGGYTVMIEMNHNFPLFRSQLLRDSVPKEQRYLPTLEQYAGVFRHAGFELQTVKNFCWIPHSASSTAVALLGAASPLLQTLFARFATRSLIVGRKPQ